MNYINDRFIIVFATTRAFIQGEKRVKEIPHQIINTPRSLYDQCGMCLCFSEELRSEVEKLLPRDSEDLIYMQAPDNENE